SETKVYDFFARASHLESIALLSGCKSGCRESTRTVLCFSWVDSAVFLCFSGLYLRSNAATSGSWDYDRSFARWYQLSVTLRNVSCGGAAGAHLMRRSGASCVDFMKSKDRRK